MGPDKARRVRVFITGTVQGVWFRESTRQEAAKLNVEGWVRNLPDGRVEAVLQGVPFAVEQLLAWCQHGPENARVRHVEVIEEEPQEEGGFAVRQ